MPRIQSAPKSSLSLPCVGKCPVKAPDGITYCYRCVLYRGKTSRKAPIRDWPLMRFEKAFKSPKMRRFQKKIAKVIRKRLFKKEE